MAEGTRDLDLRPIFESDLFFCVQNETGLVKRNIIAQIERGMQVFFGQGD